MIMSPGPVLYWSDRVGKGNRIFRMPKFRTMRIGTPAVATHLLADPGQPQIFTILKGDMSIVGPRPALFNQDDLIALRTAKGVHELTPGLTGWAQVNGRDELPKNCSLLLDLKIILLTAKKVIGGEGVAH